MGEVQEQRYICKICNKSCSSGKSLGGHMRVHLALISASKKAASAKAESKMEIEGGDGDQEDATTCKLKESSKNQSNSTFPTEEKIKNSNRNTDYGDDDDDDETYLYEWRNNPKRSRGISDSITRVPEKVISCKECGKEFTTLRAVSGHMRCHSIKNSKKSHCCKKCGKGFNSMRAMFGHMKSHSKKLRTLDESNDSVSDLENFRPFRRKRSKIVYKSALSGSISSVNTDDEVGEVEAAATCLLMLSKGVSGWDKFKSVTEFSDDDSAYYLGDEYSIKGKEIAGTDGGFGNEMSLLDGKLDSGVSGSGNSFSEKNVLKLDPDSMLSADIEMKVGFGIPDYGLISVKNEMEVDLTVCIDGMHSTDDIKEPEVLKECSIKLEHNTGNTATVANIANSEFLKFNSWNEVRVFSFHESNLVNEIDDHESLTDFLEKMSLKSLEGHDVGYKIQEYKSESQLLVTETASKYGHPECSDNQLKSKDGNVGIVSLESSKNKKHECLICFKVFGSGQALGGHKRAHNTGSKIEEAIVVNQENAKTHEFLDLNIPMNVDEQRNPWWIQRAHEHETLVLTS